MRSEDGSKDITDNKDGGIQSTIKTLNTVQFDKLDVKNVHSPTKVKSPLTDRSSRASLSHNLHNYDSKETGHVRKRSPQRQDSINLNSDLSFQLNSEGEHVHQHSKFKKTLKSNELTSSQNDHGNNISMKNMFVHS